MNPRPGARCGCRSQGGMQRVLMSPSMAEESRSPRDVELYHLVKAGLERLAGQGDAAEATATARLPKVH